MPQIIIPAVISAGVGLYSASQQKKAADQGLAAQTAANDKALAAQQQNFNTVVGLNEPFRQGGLGAFDQLLAEYGIKPFNGSTQTTPSASGPSGPGDSFTTRPDNPAGGGVAPQGQQGGGPDWNAYLQANPDVMAEYQRARASADPNSPAFAQHGLDSPEHYAAWHYQNYGQAEGRQVPTVPAQPGQTPQTNTDPTTPAQPAGPSPANPPTDLLTATRPDAGPAPTFTRPEDMRAPTFGDAPKFSAYFDPNNFQLSPDYQFRLKQGLDSTNAGFAARGLLKSGAAAKGITDYASNLASGEFGNAFSRGLSLYNTDLNQYNTNRNYGTNLFLQQQGRQDQNFENDRGFGTDAYRFGVNRTDTNFNTDRGFQANRYDTRIGNIFDLAKFGTQATANITGASNNLANNSSNIYQDQGLAAAGAAQQRGAASAYGAGALGSAFGNVYAAYRPQTTSADPYSDYSFARI